MQFRSEPEYVNDFESCDDAHIEAPAACFSVGSVQVVGSPIVCKVIVATDAKASGGVADFSCRLFGCGLVNFRNRILRGGGSLFGCRLLDGCLLGRGLLDCCLLNGRLLNSSLLDRCLLNRGVLLLGKNACCRKEDCRCGYSGFFHSFSIKTRNTYGYNTYLKIACFCLRALSKMVKKARFLKKILFLIESIDKLA